jgi:hypothetical protein
MAFALARRSPTTATAQNPAMTTIMTQETWQIELQEEDYS